MTTTMIDAFRLDGRVALVTGSTQGIGQAIATGLAEAGAVVAINGRDAGKVARAAASLREAGHRAIEAPFDVTRPDEVEAGLAAIARAAGPLAIVVNNAGLQRRGSLDEIEAATWRELMALNLDAVFYVSKAAAKQMIPLKRGAIINIASVMSELSRPTVTPYAASKGGVKMLTKGMAIDWGRHGIRVNAIGPGYFRTEINEALIKDEKFNAWLLNRTPMGRWGDLRELAGAAVFLASDAASFVTGNIMYVDGGVTSAL